MQLIHHKHHSISETWQDFGLFQCILNESMIIYKIVLLLMFISVSDFSVAQSIDDEGKPKVGTVKSIENNISFNENLNGDKLEYKLTPISDGRFKLIFINRPTEYVRIEIYDIIGNLILSEDNKYSLNTEIEYNFNEKNNKIYVVKVESGEDNLTKKVNF